MLALKTNIKYYKSNKGIYIIMSNVQNKVYTKEMLQEECGLVDVSEFTFTRDVYKEKAKRRVVTVTQPSLRFDLTEDKKVARYVNAVVSLYNYKTKKYVNMSYSKLVWIWNYGSCPIDVCIDHIDTNSLNNRLDNLRVVTLSGNESNRKKWKPFFVELIKGKSVEEVCKMIAQRIEEYKDNPYKVVYKKQDTSTRKPTQHTKEFIEMLIKKLNEQINDLYLDCYHRPDYIANKVFRLKSKIKELKSMI